MVPCWARSFHVVWADMGGVARACAIYSDFQQLWREKKNQQRLKPEMCLLELSSDFSASGFIVKVILCAGKLM